MFLKRNDRLEPIIFIAAFHSALCRFGSFEIDKKFFAHGEGDNYSPNSIIIHEEFSTKRCVLQLNNNLFGNHKKASLNLLKIYKLL
jgi:hypothetical protein